MSDELQTSAPIDTDTRSQWERGVEVRFKLGDTQFGRIRRDMKDMRAELQANSDITNEIRDVVMAFASFSRFCKRCGKGLAWCGRRLAVLGTFAFRVLKVGGAVAASIAAIWGVIWAIKNGMPPPAATEALPGHEQPQGRSSDRGGAPRK